MKRRWCLGYFMVAVTVSCLGSSVLVGCKPAILGGIQSGRLELASPDLVEDPRRTRTEAFCWRATRSIVLRAAHTDQ